MGARLVVLTHRERGDAWLRTGASIGPPRVTAMRPLQSIAMGLVIVALHAEFGGFDALPDPLGWVLVLLGRPRPARATSSRGARSSAWRRSPAR